MSRYEQILGLNEWQPKEEYVCFLPWVSEFGWYIMNHVKRFHGYNHSNKIACIKPGHECLFPTATEFFYDWEDNVPDKNKAGIVKYQKHNQVIAKIKEKYGNSVKFVYPEETGWEEKKSLAHHTFVPKPLKDHGDKLKVDIVITPRLRIVERTRNYKHWQDLVDKFVAHGWTVGVCGKYGLTVPVKNVKCFAYQYTDVDSDVEMMLKSKMIITQESGLAYLALMCRKPVFVLDKTLGGVMEKHRTPNTFFKEMPWVWNQPHHLLKEIKKLMVYYS